MVLGIWGVMSNQKEGVGRGGGGGTIAVPFRGESAIFFIYRDTLVE